MFGVRLDCVELKFLDNFVSLCLCLRHDIADYLVYLFISQTASDVRLVDKNKKGCAHKTLMSI